MLNHLLKPKIIDVDFHSDNYAKVVLEPFEEGLVIHSAMLSESSFILNGRFCRY